VTIDDDKMISLKPCSFCGSNDLKLEHDSFAWAYIGCLNCGCRAPESRLDRLAVETWNERKESI